MNGSVTHAPLAIKGTRNTKVQIFCRVVPAIVLVGLGIFLWLQMNTSRGKADEDGWMYSIFAVLVWVIAAAVPFHKRTYLDFADRQIVTLKHYAWYQISKTTKPLTHFSTIVVRHLCHPGGEGPDTYTGSVGLKPVDGRAVLWVKDFPTTQDEVPHSAYEFAAKLQEMTGLRLADNQRNPSGHRIG